MLPSVAAVPEGPEAGRGREEEVAVARDLLGSAIRRVVACWVLVSLGGAVRSAVLTVWLGTVTGWEKEEEEGGG